MVALFLGALGVLLLMSVGDWFLKAPPHSLRRGLGLGLAGLLIVVIAAFVLSGRLAMAAAGFFVLVPWVLRLINIWALGRFWHRAFRSRSGFGYDEARASDSGRWSPSSSSSMDRAEALRILDLQDDASPHAIQEAYQRLIRRVHPDHGGSTYLAARLNEAKKILLGQ